MIEYILVAVGVIIIAVAFLLKGGKKEKASEKAKVEVKPEPPKEYFGPINIYFGSQTGTAANFAKSLAEEAEKQGFEAKTIDLVDFDAESFQNVELAVFLMATHGEGEPTDNAKKFVEWITNENFDATTLKKLKFTAFGLGNKQYQFYNAMGKKTNENLARLGAERVYKYGEGDDDGSLEDDFNEWKVDLWKDVKQKVGAREKNAAQTEKPKSKLPFLVKVDNSASEINIDAYDLAQDGKDYDFQTKQFFVAKTTKITSIRELRQKDDDGSTLHIEIDVGAIDVKYRTADNLAVYPENTEEDVERLAKLLDLNLKDIIVLGENPDSEKKVKSKFPFPSPLSVRTYLTWFCDLRSALRKKQLNELAEFCRNEDKKKKLQFLASNDGKTEFEVQVSSQMKGLMDLVEEYDIGLTIDSLVHISSNITPRLFTIASSAIKHPTNVHLCATKQIDIIGSKQRIGLCSEYLDRLYLLSKKGKSLPRVRVAARESTFSLPKNPETPVIMIASGAGIAPFKGFVDEKDHILSKGEKSLFGEMTLFFGCRGNCWDYLYKDELTALVEKKVINNHIMAFSRDQEKKVYVQDMIEKNKDLVLSLIYEKEAILYLCGSLRMGRDVLKRLGDIIAAKRNISPEEGEKIVADLEKNKKIIKEVWG